LVRRRCQIIYGGLEDSCGASVHPDTCWIAAIYVKAGTLVLNDDTVSGEAVGGNGGNGGNCGNGGSGGSGGSGSAGLDGLGGQGTTGASGLAGQMGFDGGDGETALVPGKYQATATYSGDADLDASRSRPIAFSVTKASTLSTRSRTSPRTSLDLGTVLPAVSSRPRVRRVVCAVR
jgi:hypothetical protein